MGTHEPDREGSKRAASGSPIPFASAETLQSPARGGASAPVAADSGAGGSGSASSLPADELLAGRRVGKYQLVRMLGKGGMGTVFEAIDVILHRKVALKILPREFSDNEESLKRFIREARLAARLNHPNAVGVYDVGRKGTTYYIAMELVRGASVQQLLESSRDLSWREATQWIADACRALAAAHAAGLVHRDIKPANMLRSDSGAVKLSDFGLAKPTDGAKNLTLTQKDAFIGTPLFMSPEQCRNDKIDPRSDIYGLGATYYTLLTGEPPYHQGTALQILFAHCSAPIPDPCERNTQLPAMCTHIVRKAMAKDAAQRYPSADQMLADLEALLADPTTAAADPMLSAMEDLAPAGAAGGSAIGRAPAAWQPHTGMARRQRRMLMLGAAVGVVLLVGGGIIAALLARSSSEESAPAIARASQSDPMAQAAPAAPQHVEQTTAIAETPAVAAAPHGETGIAPREAVPSHTPAQAAPAAPATQPVALAVANPPVAPPPQPEVPAATQPPPQQPPPTVQPARAPPDASEEAPPPPPGADEPIGADGQNDPAIRAYAGAKRWAAAAALRKDQKALERGARALILWHDFFAASPHDFHAPLVEESVKLAEQYAPGIGTKHPRVAVASVAGGPPVPPKNPPEGGADGRRPPPSRPPPKRPAQRAK